MIYLNGSPLNITLFPDKTSQVWQISENLLKNTNFFNVKWEFEHEGEFMHLAQLKNLLDHYKKQVSLRLNYLPYARQDKGIDNFSTFALTTFASLLNQLNFKEITIVDPHSNVALDLIHNSKALYPISDVEKVMQLTNSNLLCYPDKGAVSKYTTIYNHPHIFGEKVRDQLTGNILLYQIIGNSQDKTVLIVDDLCDGGMTFKLLTKDLLISGAKEVNLFVTHGLFSKGLETLKQSGINRVFTQAGEALEIQGSIFYEKM